MKPEHPYYGSMAKERIISALLFLMKDNEFDEISVLQITQEAEVARRTFYLYYNSKIDVLNDYYNVLARKYYSSLPDEVLNDPLRQAESFFTFWKKHHTYLRILDKHNLLFILIGSLKEYLTRTVDEGLLGNSLSYYTSFYAGGLWALLQQWIREGFRETPAELAVIAVRFNYLNIFRQNPIEEGEETNQRDRNIKK